MPKLDKEQTSAFESLKNHARREGGNWKTCLNYKSYCVKFDCINRDIKCISECWRFSCYETN